MRKMTLLLPVVVMIAFGFNDTPGRYNQTWEGFTLKWFYGFDDRGRPVGLFQDQRMGQAIWSSRSERSRRSRWRVISMMYPRATSQTS
jgi:ABC-type spermidine/putrescine transport system permease subunit II